MSSLRKTRRSSIYSSCLLALIVGIVLTVMFIYSGIVYFNGRFYCGLNTHVHLDDGERSHYTGWVVLESGETLRYRETYKEYETSTIWPFTRAATIAGRARQDTDYFQFGRGFPFLCISYFETPYAPHGFHSNVVPADLEVYPKYKFDSFLWGGLTSNLLLWSILAFAALITPRWFRSYRRRRKGLCVNCGYNLTGLSEQRCPECGSQFDLNASG